MWLQVEEATQAVSETSSSASQASKDSSTGTSSSRGPASIASGMMMKFLGNGSA